MNHRKVEVVIEELSRIRDFYEENTGQSIRDLRVKAQNSIVKDWKYDSHSGVLAHLQGKGTKFTIRKDRLDYLIRAWLVGGSDELRNYYLQMLTSDEDKKILEEYFDSVMEFNLPEEITTPQVFYEGAKQTIVVNKYERNEKARRKCIDYHGAKCCVCCFSFERVYGSVGRDFIHVHHLVKLSQIGGEYEVDPVKDLCPVCPNCHAIIHRKEPHYSIEEVKEMMRGSL